MHCWFKWPFLLPGWIHTLFPCFFVGPLLYCVLNSLRHCDYSCSFLNSSVSRQYLWWNPFRSMFRSLERVHKHLLCSLLCSPAVTWANMNRFTFCWSYRGRYCTSYEACQVDKHGGLQSESTNVTKNSCYLGEYCFSSRTCYDSNVSTYSILCDNIYVPVVSSKRRESIFSTRLPIVTGLSTHKGSFWTLNSLEWDHR